MSATQFRIVKIVVFRQIAKVTLKLRKLLRKLNRLFGIIFLCKLTTDYADYMDYSLVVYYSPVL